MAYDHSSHHGFCKFELRTVVTLLEGRFANLVYSFQKSSRCIRREACHALG